MESHCQPTATLYVARMNARHHALRHYSATEGSTMAFIFYGIRHSDAKTVRWLEEDGKKEAARNADGWKRAAQYA